MTNYLGNGRKIISIVSVDKNWGIGNAGNLLAHLPGDMKFFKETTMGNIVVMGRKTFESLPGAKPLVGRLNIIVTRNSDYAREAVRNGEVLIASSPEDAIAFIKADVEDKRDLYIIGGGEIYKQFLPYVDSCLVTKIDAEYKADTFFSNLDIDEDFEMIEQSAPFEENEIEYVFTEYSRI